MVPGGGVGTGVGVAVTVTVVLALVWYCCNGDGGCRFWCCGDGDRGTGDGVAVTVTVGVGVGANVISVPQALRSGAIKIKDMSIIRSTASLLFGSASSPSEHLIFSPGFCLSTYQFPFLVQLWPFK